MMIDERKDIREILREMTRQLDGRVYIIATTVAITLLILNLIRSDYVAGQPAISGKWIMIWSCVPVLLFLIYTQLRQLIEGSGYIVNFIRSLFIIVPTFYLAYINLFGNL